VGLPPEKPFLSVLRGFVFKEGELEESAVRAKIAHTAILNPLRKAREAGAKHAKKTGIDVWLFFAIYA